MPSLAVRVGSWFGLPTPDQVKQLEGEVSHLIAEKTRKRQMSPVASGVETNFGEYLYEKNEKLRGSSRWDEYDGMMADPHIKASVRSYTHALTKAEWEVKPASDKPRDVEIAEFVAANLLRVPSDRFGSEFFCSSPWKTQRLPEIMANMEHGFSMFAKSTKVVKGKLVYDRLQWLEPSSVDPSSGWHTDELDNLLHVKRTYRAGMGTTYKYNEKLEAHQIALYPFDFRGARYEGTPFIRCMWGAWVRKSYMQRMSAIWTQKAGAPAPYGFHPRYSGAEFTRFKEFIEGLRGTSPAETHFVGPLGSDGSPPVVGYAGAELNIDRGLSQTIDSEDRQIAHGGGTKHMQLGETESGSRSTADSQGMSEMGGVEAYAERIAEYERHGVGNLRGLYEELVGWNYAGADPPELVCSKANPFEMRNSLDAKITAWTAGIIPHHADARRQIVEGDLGLNLDDEAYEIEEPIVPNPLVPSAPDGANGQQPPVNGDEGDGEPQQKQMSLESAEEFRVRIAHMLAPMEDAPSGGKFRARNQLEASVLNLAAIEQAFRVGEGEIVTELRAAHRAMIDDLMGRLRAGKVTLQTVGSQRRSSFKGARRVTNRLVKVFTRSGAAGWSAVADELDRQHAS